MKVRMVSFEIVLVNEKRVCECRKRVKERRMREVVCIFSRGKGMRNSNVVR